MSPEMLRARDTSRRRQIERRLFAGGLVRGPRRLRVGGKPEVAEPTGRELILRLHDALSDLGPVFASFGVYLSRRPDVLATEDCLTLSELSRASPRPALGMSAETMSAETMSAETMSAETMSAETISAETISAETIGDLVTEALGLPSHEVFRELDPEPRSVDLLTRAHRAVLADGQPVLVRLRRRDLEAQMARDLPFLPLFERVFARHPTMAFGEVSSDFRRWIEDRGDLTVEAGQLEKLARHAVDSDLLVVPRVHRRLTAAGILTVDWIDGVEIGNESRLRGHGPARRRDIARRLHLLWLEQAMVGGLFPVEADVVLTRDGSLGLVGGEFMEIPEVSRANLWQYLRSTAAHELDEACECLARELECVRPGAGERDLLLHLRQVVPFRDGAWSERGDTLAEYLILHWQVARARGFAPRRHLVAFYQGVFWAARVGQRLAPHADALREAQENMRWLAGWIQFRQLTDPRQLGESLEANLASLLELPQKIDQVLDLAASDEPRFRVQAGERAAGERKRRSAVMICLCLMLATLVMVSNQLGTVWAGDQWLERLSAALFILGGGALLWEVWR